jgi:hypothetical protein
MKKTLAAIGLMVCSTGALSIELKNDGNELLEQCRIATDQNTIENVDNALIMGYCLGKIQGIRQTLDIFSYNYNLPPEQKVCIPTNVTNGQAARIVVKFLEDNPDQLHLSQTVLAIQAFKTAFPCKT